MPAAHGGMGIIPAMSERGQPSPDAAGACPFVAFEDERDERSTRPDHRHRCYAELRPAPRALAHQEAYCLSASFAACPTFRDWARREAARARPSAAAPPVAEVPPYDAGHGRRPSDWTAPPPWMADGSAPGAAASPAPDFLASRDRPPVPPPAGAGLAESAALAAAGPVRASEDEIDDVDGSPAQDGHPATSPASARRTPATSSRGAQSRRRPGDGVDLDEASRAVRGPSWERPHRYEAYPTLRTRVGLPGVPRLVIGFVALIVAALALFFVPTLLLRPGGSGGDAGGGPTPSTASSADASAAVSPTPQPSPTPQVYTIAAGDTLSKVAAKYNVPLDQLIAANPSIKNPDRVNIGDQVIIPTPTPGDVFDTGSSPSASPSGP
jgi:LysM repeat protein